jgi:hypothetical protein
MKVGDLVIATEESGFILRCATGQYVEAVVISLDPFILTDDDGSMLWSSTIKKEEFQTIGKVSKHTLKKCMRRLNG